MSSLFLPQLFVNYRRVKVVTGLSVGVVLSVTLTVTVVEPELVGVPTSSRFRSATPGQPEHLCS